MKTKTVTQRKWTVALCALLLVALLSATLFAVFHTEKAHAALSVPQSSNQKLSVNNSSTSAEVTLGGITYTTKWEDYTTTSASNKMPFISRHEYVGNGHTFINDNSATVFNTDDWKIPTVYMKYSPANSAVTPQMLFGGFSASPEIAIFQLGTEQALTTTGTNYLLDCLLGFGRVAAENDGWVSKDAVSYSFFIDDNKTVTSDQKWSETGIPKNVGVYLITEYTSETVTFKPFGVPVASVKVACYKCAILIIDQQEIGISWAAGAVASGNEAIASGTTISDAQSNLNGKKAFTSTYDSTDKALVASATANTYDTDWGADQLPILDKNYQYYTKNASNNTVLVGVDVPVDAGEYLSNVTGISDNGNIKAVNFKFATDTATTAAKQNYLKIYQRPISLVAQGTAGAFHHPYGEEMTSIPSAWVSGDSKLWDYATGSKEFCGNDAADAVSASLWDATQNKYITNSEINTLPVGDYYFKLALNNTLTDAQKKHIQTNYDVNWGGQSTNKALTIIPRKVVLQGFYQTGDTDPQIVNSIVYGDEVMKQTRLGWERYDAVGSYNILADDLDNVKAALSVYLRKNGLEVTFTDGVTYLTAGEYTIDIRVKSSLTDAVAATMANYNIEANVLVRTFWVNTKPITLITQPVPFGADAEHDIYDGDAHSMLTWANDDFTQCIDIATGTVPTIKYAIHSRDKDNVVPPDTEATVGYLFAGNNYTTTIPTFTEVGGAWLYFLIEAPNHQALYGHVWAEIHNAPGGKVDNYVREGGDMLFNNSATGIVNLGTGETPGTTIASTTPALWTYGAYDADYNTAGYQAGNANFSLPHLKYRMEGSSFEVKLSRLTTEGGVSSWEELASETEATDQALTNWLYTQFDLGRFVAGTYCVSLTLPGTVSYKEFTVHYGFVVAKKQLDIVVQPATVQYGDEATSLTYTYTGLVRNSTNSNVPYDAFEGLEIFLAAQGYCNTHTVVDGVDQISGAGSGPYTIVATGYKIGDAATVNFTAGQDSFNWGNYVVKVDSSLGKLTVEKRQVSIAIPSVSVVLGSTLELDFLTSYVTSVRGIVEGDDPYTLSSEALSTSSTGGGSWLVTNAPGSYDIVPTVSNAAKANYNFTFTEDPKCTVISTDKLNVSLSGPYRYDVATGTRGAPSNEYYGGAFVVHADTGTTDEIQYYAVLYYGVNADGTRGAKLVDGNGDPVYPQNIGNYFAVAYAKKTDGALDVNGTIDENDTQSVEMRFQIVPAPVTVTMVSAGTTFGTGFALQLKDSDDAVVENFAVSSSLSNDFADVLTNLIATKSTAGSVYQVYSLSGTNRVDYVGATANVGNYFVNFTTDFETELRAAAPGYTITVIPGILAVSQKTVYVTFNNGTTEYGTAFSNVDSLYSIVDNVITKDVFKTYFTVATVATMLKPVGEYDVTCTAIVDSDEHRPDGYTNYNFVLGSLSKVSVTRKTLTITINSGLTVVYGTSTTAEAYFTSDKYTVSGKLSGDTVTPTFTCGAFVGGKTANVGSYSVSVELDSESAKNYTLDVPARSVEVTPFRITKTDLVNTYGLVENAGVYSFNSSLTYTGSELSYDWNVSTVVFTASSNDVSVTNGTNKITLKVVGAKEEGHIVYVALRSENYVWDAQQTVEGVTTGTVAGVDEYSRLGVRLVVARGQNEVTGITVSDKVYDGKALAAPVVSLKFEGATVTYQWKSTDPGSTYSDAVPVHAGTYNLQIVVADTTNTIGTKIEYRYESSELFIIAITKAVLTVTPSGTITYGTALNSKDIADSLSWTITGWAEGENETNAAGWNKKANPTFICQGYTIGTDSKILAANATGYDMTFISLDNAFEATDYELNTGTGKLVVNKAAIKLSIKAASLVYLTGKNYSSADIDSTLAAGAWVGSDGLGTVTSGKTISFTVNGNSVGTGTTYIAGLGVGDYVVKASVTVDNYDITFVDGALTITKLPVKVVLTASNAKFTNNVGVFGDVSGTTHAVAITGANGVALPAAFAKTEGSLYNLTWTRTRVNSVGVVVTELLHSGSSRVEAGTYNIMLDLANSNCELTDDSVVAASYTINKKDLALPTIDYTNYNYIYNGAKQVPHLATHVLPEVFAAKYGDVLIAELGASELDSSLAIIDAGSYEIVCTIGSDYFDNYQWATVGGDTYKLSFAVQKATVTVTVDKQTLTYGRTGFAQVAATNVSGLPDADKSQIELSCAAYDGATTNNVGEYPVLAAFKASYANKDNYTLNVIDIDNNAANVKVVPQTVERPTLVGAVDGKVSATFDGTEKSATLQNGVATGLVVVHPAVSGRTENGTSITYKATNVGTYTIVCKLSDTTNYNWTGSDKTGDISLTWEIGKATPTISATSASFVYDGESHAIVPVVSSYVAPGDITVTYNGAASATTVGEYAVVISVNATANYNAATFAASEGVTLTISPKPIDVTVVCTDNASGVDDYNSAWAKSHGTFDYNVDGLIGADAANKAMVIKSGETLAWSYTKDGAAYAPVDDESLAAGSYTVTANFAAKDTVVGTNYKINSVTVTSFTVNQLVLHESDISVSAEIDTYDGAEHDIDVSADAVSAYVTIGIPTKVKDAGTYDVTFKLNDTDNFRWETTLGDIYTAHYTVKKADLTVTVKDLKGTDAVQYSIGYTYGLSNLTVSDLAAHETTSVEDLLDGKLNFALSYDDIKALTVGRYTASVAVSDLTNYKVTVEDGILEIVALPVKVTLSVTEDDKVYGEDFGTPWNVAISAPTGSTVPEGWYTLSYSRSDYAGANVKGSSETEAKTDAGFYTVLLVVSNNNFTLTSDSTSVVTYTINKKQLLIPTIAAATFSASGCKPTIDVHGASAYSVTYDNNGIWEALTAETSFAHAGEYDIKFTVKDAKNTIWEDGQVATTVKFEVKQLVVTPTLGTINKTYGQTVTAADLAAISVTGLPAGTKLTYDQALCNVELDAGTYYVDATLAKDGDSDVALSDYVLQQANGDPIRAAVVVAQYLLDAPQFYTDAADKTALTSTYTGSELNAKIKNANVAGITVNYGGLANGTSGNDVLLYTTNANTTGHTISCSLANNNYAWNDGTDHASDSRAAKTFTWTIEKATPSVTIEYDSVTFDTNAHAISVKSVSSFVNAGDVVLTYYKKNGDVWEAGTTTAPINAGTYKVVATITEDQNGNYTALTAEGSDNVATLTINKAKLTITVKPTDGAQLVFDSTWAKTPTFDFEVAGWLSSYTLDKNNLKAESFAWSCTDKDGAAYTLPTGATSMLAGDYTVTGNFVASLQNYDVEVAPATFTVSKAQNALTGDIVVKSWIYKDSPSGKVSATVKYSDEDHPVVFWYSTNATTGFSATLPTDAGLYFVVAKVSGLDNVEDFTSEPVGFQIEKLVYELPPLESTTYNGKAQSVVINKDAENVIIISDPLNPNLIFAAETDKITLTATNAGSYNIPVSLNNQKNYILANNYIVWTISFCKTNDFVFANNTDSFTYGNEYRTVLESIAQNGEAPLLGADTVTFTYYVEKDDDVGLKLSEAPKHAGTYRVVAEIAATGNYNSVSKFKSFSIGQKEITLPPSGTMVYGATVSNLKDVCTVIADGLVEGDSIASLSLTFSVKQSKAATEVLTLAQLSTLNVGSYYIKVDISGSISSDYIVSINSESEKGFTVTPRDITVTVDDKTAVYMEAALPTYTCQVTDGELKNGLKLDNLVELSCTPATDSYGKYKVGTYDIVGTTKVAQNDNYNVTIFKGQLTISALQVNVTLNVPTSLEYDGTAKTYSIANATSASDKVSFTYGSDSAVSLGIVYNGTANSGDALTANSTTAPTDAGSYSVTIVSNNESIEVANATTNFEIAKKAIGQSVAITSANYTGEALTPEVTGVATGLYNIDDHADFVNAGSYTVGLTLADANNYKWATSTDVAITRTFVVNKIKNTVDITVGENNPVVPTGNKTSWTYGDDAAVFGVKLTYDSDTVDTGSVSYRFYKSKSETATYTQSVPTDAGTYYLGVFIPASTNCLAYTTAADARMEITINPKEIKIADVVLNNLNGGKPYQYTGATLEVGIPAEGIKLASGNTLQGFVRGDYIVVQAVDANPDGYEIVVELANGNYVFDEPGTTNKTLTWKVAKAETVLTFKGNQKQFSFEYGQKVVFTESEMDCNIVLDNVVFKYYKYNDSIELTDLVAADYLGDGVAPINCGKYVVVADATPSAANINNFTPKQATALVTVTPAKLTITVKPTNGAQLVFDSTWANKPTFTYTVEGWLLGDEKKNISVVPAEFAYTVTKDGQAYEAPLVAGDYAATANFLDALDNYTIDTVVAAEFSIAKRVLDASAITVSESATYSGKAVPAVDIDAAITGRTEIDKYTTNNINTLECINAGRYDVVFTITDTANVAWSTGSSRNYSVKFVVEKLVLNSNDIKVKSGAIYSGKQVSAEDIKRAIGTTLTIDAYTTNNIADLKCINAGSYTVVFSVDANNVEWADSDSATFEVQYVVSKKAATINIDNVSVSYSEDFTTKFSFTQTGVCGEEKLKLTRYTTDIPDDGAVFAKVGSYTIDGVFDADETTNRNYDITVVTGILSITKLDVEAALTLTDSVYNYGEDTKASASVKFYVGKDVVTDEHLLEILTDKQYVTLLFKKGLDETFTDITKIVNAGTYSVVVRCTNKNINVTIKDGSATEFVIAPIVIRESKITAADQTYTGKGIVPEITDMDGMDNYYRATYGGILIKDLTTDNKLIVNVRTEEEGPYEIQLKLKDSTNFKWENTNGDTCTVSFKVLPAKNELDKPLDIDSFMHDYGDRNNGTVPGVKYDEEEATVTTLYSADDGKTWQNVAPTDVGEYLVKLQVSATKNHTGFETQPQAFEIKAKVIDIPTPEFAAGGYVYNTKEQSLRIDFDGNLMSVEVPEGVRVTTDKNGATFFATDANPDGYQITFTLRNSKNYNWSGTKSDTATIVWKIARIKLAVPQAAEKTKFFMDGRVFVYEPANDSFDPTTMVMSNGENSQAGRYKAIISIADKTNYEWDVSDPKLAQAEFSFDWQIIGQGVIFAIVLGVIGAAALVVGGIFVGKIVLHRKHAANVSGEGYEAAAEIPEASNLNIDSKTKDNKNEKEGK